MAFASRGINGATTCPSVVVVTRVTRGIALASFVATMGPTVSRTRGEMTDGQIARTAATRLSLLRTTKPRTISTACTVEGYCLNVTSTCKTGR
jgi:hypothetical protein